MNGNVGWFRIRHFSWLVVLLFAAAGIGCGGSKTGTVTGTVKYRGTPLPAGNVTFFGDKKEVLGNAAIHEGKYTMEGVKVGTVKVAVTTPPSVMADRRHPPPADMPGGAPSAVVNIPPGYSNPEQSRLTYEVKPGSQDYPIELQ